LDTETAELPIGTGSAKRAPHPCDSRTGIPLKIADEGELAHRQEAIQTIEALVENGTGKELCDQYAVRKRARHHDLTERICPVSQGLLGYRAKRYQKSMQEPKRTIPVSSRGASPLSENNRESSAQGPGFPSSDLLSVTMERVVPNRFHILSSMPSLDASRKSSRWMRPDTRPA